MNATVTVESVELLVDTVENAVDALAGRPLSALTGAGLSTDSGIPDYRGPGSPRRTPMTYQEFLSGPSAQRRYWARSHVGWTRIGRAAPNDGHRALAALECSGPLRSRQARARWPSLGAALPMRVQPTWLRAQ